LKIPILSILVCCYITLSAQPILVAHQIYPTVNDKFTKRTCQYVDPGPTGADQIWDLSACVEVSTYAVHTKTLPPVYIGSANLKVFDEYLATSFKLEVTTAWESIGIICDFPDREEILRFPFQFGMKYTDTFSTYQYFKNGSVGYNGIDTVSADSYGTLILPQATYSNVLRVHLVRTIGNAISPYNIVDIYRWYKNGHPFQIAEVRKTRMGAVHIFDNKTYIFEHALDPVSIPENILRQNKYKIYPNPASQTITIDSPHPLENVIVFDISGRKVLAVSWAEQIDVTSLSSGLYTITAYDKAGQLTIHQKFIKE